MSKKPQISRIRLLILAPSDIQHNEQTSDVILPRVAAAPLFSSFLKALTNSSPSEDLTSFAGYTTHTPLSLKTKYYSADVNLWCDELPLVSTQSEGGPSEDLLQWKEQMLSAEAGEVRDVLGGIIILIPFNAAAITRAKSPSHGPELQYILAASELRDRIEDETGRDVATLAVVQDITPSATVERTSSQDHDQTLRIFAQQLEDSCVSDHGIFGWDIVTLPTEASKSDHNDEGLSGIETKPQSEAVKTELGADRNEFGEKTGIARVIEVLEQIDWLSSTPGEADQALGYDLVSTDEFLEDEDGFTMPTLKANIALNSQPDQDPIRAQSNEFQSEIMSLRSALYEQHQHKDHEDDNGEDIQVEQLGDLMQRVVAIREAASEMSGPEREAFARREINKIMQEIDMD